MIGGNATDKRGVRAVIRTTLCVLAFALASLSTLAHVLPPAMALPAVLLAFQNFLTVMAPQPLPNGGRGWAVPMDLALRVIHAGDVNEVGRTVAAAFGAGDALPNGSVLAVAGGMYSWNDFATTLNALGHDLKAVQVPADVYDRFYPGAHELREMFQYFAEHTYFGPQREARIAAANELVPGGCTSFADWARVHMKR